MYLAKTHNKLPTFERYKKKNETLQPIGYSSCRTVAIKLNERNPSHI